MFWPQTRCPLLPRPNQKQCMIYLWSHHKDKGFGSVSAVGSGMKHLGIFCEWMDAESKTYYPLPCLDIYLDCPIPVLIWIHYINLIIPLWKKFRGVYRNHSVCLYVRLCTDSSSARYLFFALTMAYHIWCITMSQCDAYIHVLYLMLILDLEVNFIGFLTCLCVWSIASVCFDIVISYMAHRSTTIKRCVEKIHDHNSTRTFNL